MEFRIYYKDVYGKVKTMIYEADYLFEAIAFGRRMFTKDYVDTEAIGKASEPEEIHSVSPYFQTYAEDDFDD